MDQLQLEDLVGAYPSLVPRFQTLISNKKEFAELVTGADPVPPPQPGQYFKHQIFTHRFLRAYNDLLIISEPGTGKTCEVVGFTEYVVKQLRRLKDNLPSDERVNHFKRFIIIVSGDNQEVEFKNQLVYNCSDGHYLDALREYEVRREGAALTEQGERGNITRVVHNAGYEIVSYRTFGKYIIKTYPETAEGDRKLAEDYSDVFLWIDEGHNIRFDPTGEDPNGVTEETRERLQVYRAIHRVFHLSRRSKRVITTATPMVNFTKELIPLMNLLLPLDGKLPPNFDYRQAPDQDLATFFPDLTPQQVRNNPREVIEPYFRGQIPADYDFNRATLEQVEPYFRGKVSYIRTAEAGAIPQYMGGLYPVQEGQLRFNMILEVTRMSSFQTASYRQAVIANRGRSKFAVAEQQASTFVYPDGWWGQGLTENERELVKTLPRTTRQTPSVSLPDPTNSDIDFLENDPEDQAVAEEDVDLNQNEDRRGYRRYISEAQGGRYLATDLLREFKKPGVIATLSSKFARIYELIEAEPDGNVFVYGKFTKGSAIPFTIGLEALGYTRYDGTALASLKKGKRYALLIGGTSAAMFKSIRDVMNSYQNRHGEYLRVLVASQVAREGINVANVLQVHLLTPEWNPSAMYQAIYRSIRATSHDFLLQEMREQLRAANLPPSQAQIQIKIYRHAAIPEGVVLSQTTPNNINSCSDMLMYATAEIKDRAIHRVMRFLKQISISCQVNRERNIRPTDQDYSVTCDYELCQYQCVDPAPTADLDFSTYDLFYTGEVLEKITNAVINLFRQTSAISLVELERQIGYERKYLVAALESIITSHLSLTDRLGYLSFLQEDNGLFYLSRSYPEERGNILSGYYSEGMVAVTKRELDSISSQLHLESEEDRVVELLRLDVKSLMQGLEELSIESKIYLVEKTFVTYHTTGQQGELYQALLKRFHWSIFSFPNPVQTIAKAQEREASLPRQTRKKQDKPGKKVKNLNRYEAAKLDMVQEEGETVYLHTLWSLRQRQTRFGASARINKGEAPTMLFVPSKREWRRLDNETEFKVYNHFIQVQGAKRIAEFESSPLYKSDAGVTGAIYGTLMNKDFRIVNKTDEKEGLDNSKKIHTGRMCISLDKALMMEIMWMLRVPTTSSINTGNVVGMIEDLRDHKEKTVAVLPFNRWPEERVGYYHFWLVEEALSVKEMCSQVQAELAKRGRIIVY